jgi:hypothetical protein
LSVRNGEFPLFQDISLQDTSLEDISLQDISLQDIEPIMIGVLVFPDFQLLDAAGPISAFEIAARFAGNAPDIKVLAVAPGPVRSTSGVELLARRFRPSGANGTLIVAGGEGVDEAARCPKTLAFVRATAPGAGPGRIAVGGAGHGHARRAEAAREPARRRADGGADRG